MLSLRIITLVLLSLVLKQQIHQTYARGIVVPLYGTHYEFDFFYNFTKYLHGIYRYNSFIIFAPNFQTRFRPDFANVRQIEQALMEDFNVPIINWCMERKAKLRKNIGLNNLVFVQFGSLTDPMLDVVDNTLEGLHFISILFFYLAKGSKPPTANDIEAFFAWCWSKNMVNVALAFKIIRQYYHADNSTYWIAKTQIFNYSPFPKLTVFNLTKQAEAGEVRFIVDRLKDVKGYGFKTPMVPNLPYAFPLNKTENFCKFVGNCDSKLSGITGRPYNEYINRLNGQIQVENAKPQEFESVMVYGAAKKLVHIGLAPVTTSMNFYNATEGSYPIVQSNACIIVPLQPHMHSGHYYWCTFQVHVWIFVFATFLILTLLQINYDKNCSTAIIKAIRLCLGQVSVASLHIQQKSLHRISYALILMMTFILTNTYIASMSSMLTSALVHKPIDTVADFLASDLKILTSPGEFELYFKTKMLPTALIPRLIIVPNGDLNRHRRFLNTSYAYIFKAEHWKMGNYQQKRLQRPIFRVPSKELCTSKFYIQIPLQWDSPFLLDLNLFFMRTQESGLSSKWREMTYWEAAQMKYIDFKKPHELPWRPLTLHDFTAARNFFCLLSYFNISIFFLEMLAYHCFVATRRERLMARASMLWKRFLLIFF